MSQTPIWETIRRSSSAGRPQLALLIDPDQAEPAHLELVLASAHKAGVDYLFVGGSLVVGDGLGRVVRYLKAHSSLPVILFPGGNHHIEAEADALLLLSLVSGRNPEFLIGQHVVAAPLLKRSGLELLPTGYMLIDGGAPTTVSYVSHTQPIPADKAGIAASTALAAEQLGHKLIYLDSGSGAKNAVPPRLIATVRREISLPLIVGGGIRTPEAAAAAWQAGADILVIGNAAEEDPGRLEAIAKGRLSIKQT